jgi:hypothetical protein
MEIFLGTLGWIWVNAGVAIIAPLVGLLLVLFIHLLAASEGGLPKPVRDRIRWVAPFRDGQMGYLGVGWAVAAYHEMHVWQTGKISTDWVTDIDIALFMLGGLSGLVAAFGSVSPMKELADPKARPKLRVETKAWFKRYVLPTSSILLAV